QDGGGLEPTGIGTAGGLGTGEACQPGLLERGPDLRVQRALDGVRGLAGGAGEDVAGEGAQLGGGLEGLGQFWCVGVRHRFVLSHRRPRLRATTPRSTSFVPPRSVKPGRWAAAPSIRSCRRVFCPATSPATRSTVSAMSPSSVVPSTLTRAAAVSAFSPAWRLEATDRDMWCSAVMRAMWRPRRPVEPAGPP